MKIFYLAIMLGATQILVACGGAPTGKQFAPSSSSMSVGQPSDQVTKSPQSQYDSSLKLSVMVPALSDNFPLSAQAMLNSQLLGIVTANGIGAMGNTSPIILTAFVTELSREITATAPAREAVRYQFLFYVANVLSGDIYGTVDLQVMGVGASSELALCNAIGSVRKSNSGIARMLNTAAAKVVGYYDLHIDKIVQQAQSLTAVNRFDEAIALLSNVPEACSGYSKAQETLNVAIDKSFHTHSADIFALMQAAIANSRDYDGCSAEAMAYYAMIPANSVAKKQADALYAQYIKKLDPAAVQRWEREGKELERNHEFRVLKEELTAKVAIEGQTALLAKYKNDANYNRLPWLRKLIHFGQ